MKSLVIAVPLLVLAATSLALTSTAAAKRRPELRVTGTCTGQATSKLQVSREDGGRLELQLEIDANRAGQRWRVVVRRNGRVVARALRRTRPPSGSFELRRLLNDAAGPDRLLVQARRLGTAERCRVAATA
jgi:hypothetical protein